MTLHVFYFTTRNIEYEYIILCRKASSFFLMKFAAFLFFKINLFIVFIYFWLHWVFTAAHGLSLVVTSRGYSSLRRTGFSCCGAQALGAWASVVVACGLSSCGSQALEHRLSSGAQA